MAPRLVVLLVAALLASSIAGCLSGEDASERGADKRAGQSRTAPNDRFIAPDWFELAIPTDPQHDHRKVQHHQNLSTPNFEILAFNPLITNYYGKTAGDYFCGDAKEKNGRRLSVIHSWGSDVAFVLVDVTDPNDPKKIGELAMANTQVYDIALTPDFNFVVMSTSPFDSGPDSPEGIPIEARPMWRDACTGEERVVKGPEAGLPYSSGVVLVDISNPLNPSVVDFRQLPIIGSHSVQVNEVKGATIITVSVDNAASLASYYAFFEVRPTVAGAKLWLLSTFHYVPESRQNYVGVHMDGTVARHPITGQRLAFLAARQVGLIIVNMENPASPVFVSNWRPFSVGIHSVLPLNETWDGRHYTILGEECGGPSRGNPSCLIYVVDTTDPTKPFLVGAWTLPRPVQWRQGLQFSMHYFAVVGRTLFVTTYHGGLWAVDLSTPEALKKMPSIGVLVPAMESPKPVGTPPRSTAGKVLLEVIAGATADDRPTLMDVVALSDGSLVTWDAQGGLYTVRFDATWEAPPPDVEIKGVTFPS